MIKYILIPIIIVSLNTPIQDIVKEPEPEQELIPLGEFKITAYSLSYECCGKYPDHPEYGITRSGRYVTPNYTVASDWDVLPKDSKIMVEGFDDIVFNVEDTGGAVIGKHIDIYMKDEERMRRFGLQRREVWLVNEEL